MLSEKYVCEAWNAMEEEEVSNVKEAEEAWITRGVAEARNAKAQGGIRSARWEEGVWNPRE